jgi:hydroxyacylglutathione hydrolase
MINANHVLLMNICVAETNKIETINLWNDSLLLKGAQGVNSYLIATDTGFIMIDSGYSSRRKDLEIILENAGCRPGNLKLVILTHGDLDHIGNCAFLQNKFRAKITLHRDELEAVINSNMALNRKNKPPLIAKMSLSLFSTLFKADSFNPEFFVKDGDNLSEYGLNASVLHIPGHSAGSIGILTAAGNLFCGDLLLNIDKPSATEILDDSTDLENSINKLRNLSFHTIYPGHGKPFSWEQFLDMINKRK